MQNNDVFVAGAINYLDTSYELDGKIYHCFELAIPRKSDKIDVLPVEIEESILFNTNLEDKDLVAICGVMGSRNTSKNRQNSHLKVYVAADEVKKISDVEMESLKNNNFVQLEGYLCKKNCPRKTHYDRPVLDTLIAYNFVNEKGRHKSYYIPCIFWGENAENIFNNYKVGDKLTFEGRFQSRKYLKKRETDFDEYTTYEVSVQNLFEESE